MVYGDQLRTFLRTFAFEDWERLSTIIDLFSFCCLLKFSFQTDLRNHTFLAWHLNFAFEATLSFFHAAQHYLTIKIKQTMYGVLLEIFQSIITSTSNLLVNQCFRDLVEQTKAYLEFFYPARELLVCHVIKLFLATINVSSFGSASTLNVLQKDFSLVSNKTI